MYRILWNVPSDIDSGSAVHLLIVWGRFKFSKFYVFTVKLPDVTQRSAWENAFKKSKNPSLFLRKTIGWNNSLTLIENNFRFLRYRSLNSRYTMVYGQNTCNCEPLIKIRYRKVLILALSCISGDAFASIKHLTISVFSKADAHISAVCPSCKSSKRQLYEK